MANNVLIVENLNSEPLKDTSEAAFFALPPKWIQADGGQIRAAAVPGLQVE
jgi:kynurenine formamidase